MSGPLAVRQGARLGGRVTRRAGVSVFRPSGSFPDITGKRFAFLGSRVGASLTAKEAIPYPALGEIQKDADGAVKLYDQWADSYDDVLESWGCDAPQRTVDAVKQHLNVDISDAKVLDLGCGTGLAGRFLTQRGFSGVKFGMDISPKSVELSQKVYNGGCFVGSLEEAFPGDVLKAGPFDAVMCCGTMAYVHKFDVMFNEVLKALKPGGIFVFTQLHFLWLEDADRIRTIGDELVNNGSWKAEYISEPIPYMPQNPDPYEASKHVFYVVYRKSE